LDTTLLLLIPSYNTPTDVDSVLLKTLCPKGVTQAVSEQLMEAAPDILQAPGKLPSGSSTSDAVAILDTWANAVDQLADVQAVKAGLIVPRDTQLSLPQRQKGSVGCLSLPSTLDSLD
jgi:hypothetical protein